MGGQGRHGSHMSETAVIRNPLFLSSFERLQISPPLFFCLFPPSMSPSLLSLCLSLPHPTLSRTTGACLLSSQCFYSLALAQGSIQSGHCIHFVSPIIHMLTLERAAFAATHEKTLIEHHRPFDSPTDCFILLIKATLSLTNKLLHILNATYKTPCDIKKAEMELSCTEFSYMTVWGRFVCLKQGRKVEGGKCCLICLYQIIRGPDFIILAIPLTNSFLLLLLFFVLYVLYSVYCIFQCLSVTIGLHRDNAIKIIQKWKKK